MKSFLVSAFFFYVVAVISAQKCIEQVECDDGMCCSGFPPFGGLCKNLTVEGGKCHIEDKVVPIFGDFVIGPCPCAEGLVCVQQGKKKNNGICQLPATTTAAPVPAEEPVTEVVPAEEPEAEVAPAEEPEAEVAPAEEPEAEVAPAEEVAE